MARSLSERDLAEVADLAKAAGKPPWIVLGFPSTTGVATLTVYLQPDATTERLRRGRILRLVADDGPGTQHSDWSLRGTARYAFVPVTGVPAEIVDERDLSCPFAVDREIDDDTLLSLVTFVRSRPPLPDVPDGAAPREVPAAPISGVWRRGDEYTVGLRLRGEEQWFSITLARRGEQWVVTGWGSFVA